MATTIDLGKVVPQKGVDYFTDADKTEIKTAVQTNLAPELTEKELKANKTPIIDENSTPEQYPEAPAVYNKLVEQDEKIAELEEQNAMLIEQIPTATATGETINVQDSSNLPIKDFKLKGNCGKNLFDKDNANVVEGYINDGTGAIVSSGKSRTIYIKCKPNTTYTLSKTQATARFVVGYSNSIPAIGTTCDGIIANNTATSITITTGANAKYLCAFVYHSDNDSPLTLAQVLGFIQIELGSTATAYEAYKNVTGDNTVTIKGKNLEDFENITYNVLNNAEISRTGDKFTVYTPQSQFGAMVFYNTYLKLKPSTTYTFSAKVVSTTSSTGSCIGIGKGLSYTGSTKFGNLATAGQISSYTFTTPAEIGTVSAFIGLYTYEQTKTAVFTDLQIEENSSATGFQKYTEQTQLLSLGDIQLDPPDEIAKVNNEWCKNTTPITDTTLISQLENVLKMHTNKNVTNVWIEPSGTNAQGELTLTYYQDLETLLNDYETRIELLETE